MFSHHVGVFLLFSVVISLAIGLPIKDDEIDELIYRLQELRNQNHYEELPASAAHFDRINSDPRYQHLMRSPLQAARHRLQLQQRPQFNAVDSVGADLMRSEDSIISGDDETMASGAGAALKRNLDSIGGANLLKRSLDSIGGANLLKRSLDSIGGANLLKRSVDSLGGAYLLKRK